jgi:hypothetical protein
LDAPGLETSCDQCGCSGNEPVQDDRYARGCGTEHEAGHARNFQAAYCCHDIDRFVSIGLMKGQRPLNDGDFSRAAEFVDPGSQARDLLNRRPSHDRCDRRARRRVADTHLTGADQRHTFFHSLGRQFDPDLEGLLGSSPIHSLSMHHISCAPEQFPVQQTSNGAEVMRDSDVHDTHLEPGMSGLYVDAGAPSQKIQHHLCRHISRIGTHTFVDHTMIGGKGIDPPAWDGRFALARDRTVLDGKLFEPTQTALRFRQAI